MLCVYNDAYEKELWEAKEQGVPELDVDEDNCPYCEVEFELIGAEEHSMHDSEPGKLSTWVVECYYYRCPHCGDIYIKSR